MKFEQSLIEARLIRRYKRFLADVELADGTTAVAHCPNPGAMLGVALPGGRIWLSRARPGAKLAYGWELAGIDGGLIGINTNRPNRIVAEALAQGRIPELKSCASWQPEVRYAARSRVDFLGTGPAGRCYLEVKNVHFRRTGSIAEFPDCVTARGARHLGDLADEVAAGHRAVMLFVIQRADCTAFRAAEDLDPHYAAEFRRTRALGVEALAYSCMISTDGIELDRAIPILG